MIEVGVQAVTFDFWNTLMWEEQGSLKKCRLEQWHEALLTVGSSSVDAAALEAAHDAAHRAYEAAWRAGRQFQVADAVALIVDRVGGELPASFAEHLAEGYRQAGIRAAVHPTNGVKECLSRLRTAGIRVGIVCDIGLTPSSVVRRLLERHHLGHFFNYMAFSDEIGHSKPSRAIFERALKGLGGPAPSVCAHVGDRFRTDVAGARGMGMVSIRFCGVFEDDPAAGPDADFVIDHLAEVPGLLHARELAN